jgi:hypothetical protein
LHFRKKSATAGRLKTTPLQSASLAGKRLMFAGKAGKTAEIGIFTLSFRH